MVTESIPPPHAQVPRTHAKDRPKLSLPIRALAFQTEATVMGCRNAPLSCAPHINSSARG